jgi:uncharacterized FlaG/YvyC family protein
MLEAVNSVLQTAPVIRASAEQVSTADSYAANPDRVQKIPQAPYISPYIHMDVDLDQAVLQIRDSETGDVVRQIPSEVSIQNRQRFQEQISLQQEVARQQAQTSADSAAVIASQAATYQPQPQQAVQQQAPQQQAVRRAPAQPQQIAAFQSAAASGAKAGASSGQVALFA